MMVRRLRYTGSLAVMMRVLVEASAWMKPPGPPLGSALWLGKATIPAACGLALIPVLEVSAEITARSVSASLVASAFLRYTTCTLPGCAVG